MASACEFGAASVAAHQHAAIIDTRSFMDKGSRGEYIQQTMR
jgi:hypothetical protein